MNVCLIGCVQVKLPRAAAACDLYISPLFKKSRAYAELNCDDWGILSAKYGLVLPGEKIGPYDVRLDRLSRARRQAWCASTFNQIVSRWGTNTTFTVLAGKPYLCATDGLDAIYPLEGLQIGERLRWLNQQIER